MRSMKIIPFNSQLLEMCDTLTPMKYNQYYMNVAPNGNVSFSGIGTGRMTVHARNNGHIILKEEGHKYWSGIGQAQGYAPAQFRVVRVLSEIEGMVKVEQVAEFPVRSQA